MLTKVPSLSAAMCRVVFAAGKRLVTIVSVYAAPPLFASDPGTLWPLSPRVCPSRHQDRRDDIARVSRCTLSQVSGKYPLSSPTVSSSPVRTCWSTSLRNTAAIPQFSDWASPEVWSIKNKKGRAPRSGTTLPFPR
ncbi:hypothetical protein EDB89DRAFT_638006 [Lactarius sanguifluus]|nr:hypothetical protein EDB89DRAFT_638006 [Lactarius sanguifluus]